MLKYANFMIDWQSTFIKSIFLCIAFLALFKHIRYTCRFVDIKFQLYLKEDNSNML